MYAGRLRAHRRRFCQEQKRDNGRGEPQPLELV
jgi:hypothetical protein